MEPQPTDRIRTLDLIRGVAVLGIVAINVASFAAPESAAYSPNLPHPTGAADQWAFLANLVLFEGKMRALFSMLFGALDKQQQTGAEQHREQRAHLALEQHQIG